MHRTSDDQALIIWANAGNILSTSFAQNIGSGDIVDFDVTPEHPLQDAVPNLDINSTNHLSLLWIHVYPSDEWLDGRLYAKPYTQLYTSLSPSFAVGPVFYQYSFPLEEFDISLRDDGRFVIVWKDPYESDLGYGSKQSGTNYSTLIGSPTGIGYLQGSICIERSPNCYWLTWRLEDQIKLHQLDSDGNFVDSIRIISADDAIGAGDPALAVSPSGSFAVCWQDARNDSGDIYCRQFNPDGSFFGYEYRVNSDPVGVMQKEPAVAFGPEDRLYFTWTDFRNPGGQGDIYCKVIEWADALDAPVYLPPLPRAFALYPPSPNPFNAVTVLSFQLPVPSHVKLDVFDVSSRLVGAYSSAPLMEGSLEAGSHQVLFDGSHLASGIYIARLQAGDYVGIQKMVLLK